MCMYMYMVIHNDHLGYQIHHILNCHAVHQLYIHGKIFCPLIEMLILKKEWSLIHQMSDNSFNFSYRFTCVPVLLLLKLTLVESFSNTSPHHQPLRVGSKDHVGHVGYPSLEEEGMTPCCQNFVALGSNLIIQMCPWWVWVLHGRDWWVESWVLINKEM